MSHTSTPDVVVGDVHDVEDVAQLRPRLVDVSDSGLAGIVFGMRLSAIHDLQAPDFGAQRTQPLRIVEEPVSAFVTGCPTREPEGQNVDVELDAGALVDFGEQRAFGLVVRRLQRVDVQPVRVAQLVIIASPLGDFPIEEPREGRGDPRRRVDTVGDRRNRVAGEHVARDFTVAHRDGVDEARRAQRQVRHVERAVLDEVESAQTLRRFGAQDALEQRFIEAIVAGRDRRVCREHAQRLHRVQ